MITASSAAREGTTSNAEIASAPMAAAQSERRLNGLRNMGLPLLLSELWALRMKVSLERQRRFAIGLPPDVPRYAAKPLLLPRAAHEFVSKIPAFQRIWRPKRKYDRARA